MTFWARIVIVAYNSGSDLQTCISHLENQTLQDFEVVIVDNASNDNAVRALRLPNDRYRILNSPKNLGFAAGSNIGAKGAKTEWVITLNPDSWAFPKWLEELSNASSKHPTYAMLSSTIIQNDDLDKLDSFGDFFSIFGIARNAGTGQRVSNRPMELCETFSPSGAAAAYKSSAFFNANGFDEDFFCYLEDVDLGYRLRLFGESCLQCPHAIVKHIGSSTVGKNSEFKYYHSYRNNITLLLKNTPLTVLMLMLPLFVSSQLWWLFRNRGKPFSQAMRQGLLDGCKNIMLALRKRRVIQKDRKITSLGISKRFSWSLSAIRNSSLIYWKL